MPISGLVITLTPDAGSPAAAAALDNHPALTCAPADGGPRLSAVLDTPDRAADRAAWDWLRSQSAVRHIDVVFIHFDDDAPDVTPMLGPDAGRPDPPSHPLPTAHQG